jgi:hypothetical protein
MTTLFVMIGGYKIGLLRYSTMFLNEEPDMKIWGAMSDQAVIDQSPEEMKVKTEESLKALLCPIVLIPDAGGMEVEVGKEASYNAFYEEQVNFVNTLLSLTDGDVCVMRLLHMKGGKEVLSPEIYIYRESVGDQMYFRVTPIPPENLPEFRIQGEVQ